MCIWVPSHWLYAAEVPIYTLLSTCNVLSLTTGRLSKIGVEGTFY